MLLTLAVTVKWQTKLYALLMMHLLAQSHTFYLSPFRDHPNIVHDIKPQYDGDQLHIETSMPGNVSFLMKATSKGLDNGMVICGFQQIADAMRYLHRNNLILCCLRASFVFVKTSSPLHVSFKYIINMICHTSSYWKYLCIHLSLSI